MNNEELIAAGRRVRREEKHFFSSAAKPKPERWNRPNTSERSSSARTSPPTIPSSSRDTKARSRVDGRFGRQRRTHYFPLNSGFCFARNALTPILKSSVLKQP